MAEKIKETLETEEHDETVNSSLERDMDNVRNQLETLKEHMIMQEMMKEHQSLKSGLGSPRER